MKTDKIWTWRPIKSGHEGSMELGVGRGPAAEESEISWVSSCRGYPEGLSCCVTTIHAILMHFLYFRINPTWRWWRSHHVQQFIFRITNYLLIYSVEEKNKYKISSGAYELRFLNKFPMRSNSIAISHELSHSRHSACGIGKVLPRSHTSDIIFLSYFSVSFLC